MMPNFDQRCAGERETGRMSEEFERVRESRNPLIRDELEALYASRMESESWLQRWQLHRARESEAEQRMRQFAW